MRAAHKQAGFKPSYKSSAELSRKPIIVARIAEIKRVALADCELDVQKVVTEFEKLAFSNMMDFIRIEGGEPYLDFSRMSREQAAAIAEITVEETTTGSGESQRTQRRTKFKLHDKLASLNGLARYMGMFVERKQIAVQGVMFHVSAEDMQL